MIFILLTACVPTEGALIDSTEEQPGFGWVDDVPRGDDPDDPEPVDWARYEDATLRVVSPQSGDFVPLGEAVTYEVELISADGEALLSESIFWSSSADTNWDGLGASFSDASLDAGLHDITAEVELPNGDRLASTVGGVRVQHALAGTYSGLFGSTGSFDAASFTCSGSALILVDALGEVGLGTGNCVASLVVFDLPLDFLFDLRIDPATGLVEGEAGADILGFLTYDFPVEGIIDADGMALGWGGTVPFVDLMVDSSLEAERVSLDTL